MPETAPFFYAPRSPISCSFLVWYTPSMTPKEQIKQRALDLGFDLVGVTTAAALPPDHGQHLQTWLERGYAGEMAYMQTHAAKRLDPRLLFKNAASILVVGLNYRPPPSADQCPPTKGRIARYAQWEEYHPFLKSRLFQLGDTLRSLLGDRVRCKVCVDTAPVAERSLAQRAGLGFIGRNHMLIHPELGPELFLGTILTSAALPPDEPVPGDCGDCHLCQQTCPTGALRRDGFLDATRCINYLTIEHHSDIPQDLHGPIGNRLYGCDACVTICPYHKRAPRCIHPEFKHDPSLTSLDLNEVLRWTPEAFQERLNGTPLERLGLTGLQRNAQLCRNNLSRTKGTPD